MFGSSNCARSGDVADNSSTGRSVAGSSGWNQSRAGSGSSGSVAGSR